MNDISTVKVQTLNLWHNTVEYQTRLKALINRLNNDTPDVLCLQEVTFPEQGKNSAEIVAEKTDLKIVAIHKQHDPERPEGTQTGNAILSRLKPHRNPHLAEGELNGYRSDFTSSSGFVPLTPPIKGEPNSSAVWSWLETPKGNALLVISSHLSWGVFNENQRFNEALDINNLASYLTRNIPDAVTVLGASMNSVPDSDSVRFLTGKKAVEDNESYWVDAWDHCNGTEVGGETQTPRNVWSRYTASQHGTQDTNRIPKRRIDYVFIRGWVYGQSGSPVTAKIVFAEPLNEGNNPNATISDHFGVETTVYDVPPKK